MLTGFFSGDLVGTGLSLVAKVSLSLSTPEDQVFPTAIPAVLAVSPTLVPAFLVMSFALSKFDF